MERPAVMTKASAYPLRKVAPTSMASIVVLREGWCFVNAALARGLLPPPPSRTLSGGGGPSTAPDLWRVARMSRPAAVTIGP